MLWIGHHSSRFALSDSATADGGSIGLLPQMRLIPSAAKLKSAVSNLVGICKVLMSANAIDSFLGDLEERYAIMYKTEGRRNAQRWLWRQIIQSLFPLVIAAIRRVSGFERLMDFFRRKRL
jgi:hypothetical protein